MVGEGEEGDGRSPIDQQVQGAHTSHIWYSCTHTCSQCHSYDILLFSG